MIAFNVIHSTKMKRLCLSFFLVLICYIGQLQAQNRRYTEEGYIVTLQNDTIYGLLKYKSRVQSCKTVFFLSATGNKKKYYASELKGYSQNRVTYRSFPLPNDLLGASAFLKEFVKGEVNLYLRYVNSVMVMGPQSQVVTKTLEIFYYRKEDSKELIRVKKLGFKDQLSDVVKADVELSAMILNKDYRYDDIVKIIEIYNQG